jgi:hypothetical protein
VERVKRFDAISKLNIACTHKALLFSHGTSQPFNFFIGY